MSNVKIYLMKVSVKFICENFIVSLIKIEMIIKIFIEG